MNRVPAASTSKTFTELHATLLTPARSDFAPAAPPELAPLVAALLDYIEEQGGAIATARPWQITDAHAKALEERMPALLALQWRRLIGVLAGTDLLHVNEEGRVCISEASPELKRLTPRAVEAMTLMLTPPTVAAGLSLSLGLHPGYTLAVANARHGDVPGATRYAAMPKHNVALAGELLSRALAITLSALRDLDPGVPYRTAALIDLFGAAVDLLRDEVGARAEAARVPLLPDALAPDTDRDRAQRFIVLDLFDHLLAPAHVVSRQGAGVFVVHPDALDDAIAVDEATTLGQSRALDDLLERASLSLVV